MYSTGSSTDGESHSKKQLNPVEEHPLVSTKDSLEVDIEDEEAIKRFLKNPHGETWDRQFWDDVTELYDDGREISWTAALNNVRIRHIKERFKLGKKDVLLCLFEIYDQFLKHVVEHQMIISFKQQFSQFAAILLQADNESSTNKKERHYAWKLPSDQGMKTILHLAAERGLLDIVKSFVEFYPGHVYEPTSGYGINRIPLEFALLNSHDDTASFLVRQMLHERVRDLFESSEVFDARFKFSDVIHNPIMKKTVVDSCINADWPYIPVKEGERRELAWSRIPDTPSRYHFYYKLLDGDLNSEPAKLSNGKINPEFNHHTPSCLQLLVGSCHSGDTISHPVVRMLVNRKWDKFGRKQIRTHFIAYIIFLIIMSIAFFVDNDYETPTKYETKLSYLRAACEVITLIYSSAYLFSEFDQMEKERKDYWLDPYNYFDCVGLCLIFALLPLRFTGELKLEWSIAAIAYLFNCLRVFKYFSAYKKIGIYSKTIAQIIYYDITKFALIYFVVMIAFSGSVYLSIKANMLGKTTSLGFFNIILREIRALAEGNPFQEDYGTFNVGIIMLLMLNMFSIIVILSNVLIGQLSYRYEKAIDEAEIQYSIDKTKFITKLERSRFVSQNMRISNYIDGDYVSADNLVAELLDDWMKLQTTKNNDVKEEFRSKIGDYIITTKEKKED